MDVSNVSWWWKSKKVMVMVMQCRIVDVLLDGLEADDESCRWCWIKELDPSWRADEAVGLFVEFGDEAISFFITRSREDNAEVLDSLLD